MEELLNKRQKLLEEKEMKPQKEHENELLKKKVSNHSNRPHPLSNHSNRWLFLRVGTFLSENI